MPIELSIGLVAERDRFINLPVRSPVGYFEEVANLIIITCSLKEFFTNATILLKANKCLYTVLGLQCLRPTPQCVGSASMSGNSRNDEVSVVSELDNGSLDEMD